MKHLAIKGVGKDYFTSSELNPLNVYPVMAKVVEYMDLSTLKMCRSLCTLWNDVAKSVMSKRMNIAIIRVNGKNKDGDLSMLDFLENFTKLNSVGFTGFRLIGLDLTNTQSFEKFAREFLPTAKMISFLDGHWNYFGFYETLRFTKCLETLVIQTRVLAASNSFVAAESGYFCLPELKSITLNNTEKYNWRHLACILHGSPKLEELNAMSHSDTVIVLKCLTTFPTACKNIVTVGITIDPPAFEWDIAEELMNSLSELNMPISSLTIGKGVLNELYAKFYHNLIVSLTPTLKKLEINGMMYWDHEFFLPTLPNLEILILCSYYGAELYKLEIICPKLKTLILRDSDILTCRDFQETDLPLPELTVYEYHDMEPLENMTSSLPQFERILRYVSNISVFTGTVNLQEFSMLLRQLPLITSVTLEANSEISDEEIAGKNLNTAMTFATTLPVVSNLTRLKYFVLKTPHKCTIGDESLIRGFSQCPLLQNLELPYTEVTIEGIQAVVQLPNLRKLNVIGCYKLNIDDMERIYKTKPFIQFN